MTDAGRTAEAILAGDRRTLARVITWIENQEPASRPVLSALYAHTGRAHLVGVTGSPGSGKSTLVNEFAKLIRLRGGTVGIVAVDPTSPFSGGAVLGDRIRMRDLAGDAGVFIRSMASRGSLGGLARTTGEVIKVLDAAGFGTVIVETVGAGQSEVEIARTAHTTVVVQAPGMGDDIQVIKAGILEVADVLVVNKADRPGADSAVKALQMMQRLGRDGRPAMSLHRRWYDSQPRAMEWAQALLPDLNSVDEWEPPVLQTVAISGEGVEEVLDAIRSHWDYLQRSGELKFREAARIERELDLLLREKLMAKLLNRTRGGEFESMLGRLLEREIDPYTAAELLVHRGADCG